MRCTCSSVNLHCLTCVFKSVSFTFCSVCLRWLAVFLFDTFWPFYLFVQCFFYPYCINYTLVLKPPLTCAPALFVTVPQSVLYGEKINSCLNMCVVCLLFSCSLYTSRLLLFHILACDSWMIFCWSWRSPFSCLSTCSVCDTSASKTLPLGLDAVQRTEQNCCNPDMVERCQFNQGFFTLENEEMKERKTHYVGNLIKCQWFCLHTDKY